MLFEAVQFVISGLLRKSKQFGFLSSLLIDPFFIINLPFFISKSLPIYPLTSADSVRCDTCKTYYHMRCLNPPLLVKPSKGYSWSCASCSKKHEEDVGVYANGGALPQNSLAPGTITEIDPEKEKERERLEAAERKKGSKPSVKPPPQPRGRNPSRRRGDRDGLNLGKLFLGIHSSSTFTFD